MKKLFILLIPFIFIFAAIITAIVTSGEAVFFIFVFFILFGIFRHLLIWQERKMYKAKVLIKRRQSILDPQGKAAEKGAQLLGMNNIKNTRIDKYIEFIVDTNNKSSAEEEVNEYCKKLLANPIMEDFEFTLEKVV